MRRSRLVLAALAAGALAAGSSAPAYSAAQGPAQRDWTAVVETTPQGGFRMGNPDAPVKLVEFVSLTCPHCADFAAEGVPRLMDGVRAGRLSLEYRSHVLNALDMGAALISRCVAPRDYFALSHAILASQEEWIGRIEALTPEQIAELRQLPEVQLVPRLVPLAGLDALAARHGLSDEQARACLADNMGFLRIVAMREIQETELGVHGTPSFLINGELQQGVHDWTTLEPLLRTAGL